MAKKPSYANLLEMVETTVRHQSSMYFFKDGAAERAAKLALYVQDHGGGIEAIIDSVEMSLKADSHICYFDDPCDAWAA